MADGRKVIVFDLDGVIVNSVDLMLDLTRESFHDLDRQGAKDLHRGNIHEMLKNSTFRKKEVTPEELQKRQLSYTAKKLKLPLYDGVRDLLIGLAKNNILTINTSSSQENCLPILEFSGVDKCFEFIATKELHSSKVEKFKIISKKFERPLSELVFITDTVGDVVEANEAGVPTIVVTWGLHTKDDFVGVPKEWILAFIDTPAELLEYLGNWREEIPSI